MTCERTSAGALAHPLTRTHPSPHTRAYARAHTHRPQEDFEPITDAFFSELATLGFIGAIVFALTYNYDSSCEGACSVMQRLSLQVLGEPMELQVCLGLGFELPG
jgi:hypothetical protein